MVVAEQLNYDAAGLIAAVVQDATTKRVLMLAYMNLEAVQLSLDTGIATFYSRSRNEIWVKGATSGNTQRIVSIEVDCDADALLVLVEPAGPACHNGTESCFDTDLLDTGTLKVGSEISRD